MNPNRVFGSLGLLAIIVPALAMDPPLGLPPVPVPADNPFTEEKAALGETLYNDERFSVTGTVSCATCHDPAKAFTDSPRRFSAGVYALTGTRNSPTVLNAAYYETQFWDGREASLEEQSLPPFLNPLEHGLSSFQPILNIVRTDPDYVDGFRVVFGIAPGAITIEHVAKAIASFERTVVAGDSPFDRYYYLGEKTAMTEQQIRGFDVFRSKGRCISCHTVGEEYALFTDNRFHNTGAGTNQIQHDLERVIAEFEKQRQLTSVEVDERVLTDTMLSELGRFAVTRERTDIGAFKTPTLRNVAVTPPYMHDGSLKTLREVVVHFNNGGWTRQGETPNAHLSEEIQPLGLSAQEIDDLVSFLEALTSSTITDGLAKPESSRGPKERTNGAR